MILGFIIHIVRVIGGCIIKIVAWLLVSLALWLPVLYTLVFVIACGLSDASLTALKSWYFAGLFVSLCGSFVISAYMYERGRRSGKGGKKTKALGNIKKVKRVEGAQSAPEINQTISQTTNQTENQAAVQAAEQSAMKGEQAPKSRKKNIVDMAREQGFSAQSFDSAKSNQNRDGQSAAQHEKSNTAEKHGFYSYQSEGFVSGYGQDGHSNQNAPAASEDNKRPNDLSGGYGKDRYSGDNYAQNDYDRGFDRPVSGGFYGMHGYNSSDDYSFSKNDFDSGFAPNSGFNGSKGGGQSDCDFDIPVSGTRSFQEKPKVFATRKDPTVFIYEYADRLEYYKRTRSGMVFMHSVSKAG